MGNVVSIVSEMDFDSRHLYVLHDSTGGISRILSSREGRMAPAVRELEKVGSLAPYYDFTALDPGKKKNQLPQKKVFDHYPYFYHVYTNLPLSTLIVQPVEEGVFLGRISFHEYGLDVVTSNLGGVLMADRIKGTLTGFDNAFLNRLGGEREAALKMLDQPLESLLTPSPRQFMEKNLVRFEPADAASYKPIWSLNSGAPEFSHAHVFSGSGKGMACDNPVANLAFLTVPIPVDTRALDFCLEARFKGGEGWPHFCLGGRYGGEDALPDEHGYWAGFHPARSKALLKRVGYAVHSELMPSVPEDGEHVMLFAVLGSSFHLFLDNRPVLRFLEKDARYFPAGFLSLGFRKGVRLNLVSLSLKTRAPTAKTRPSEPLKHIVSLKAGSDMRFVMENYYRPLFQHEDMDFYMLYDVTDLERTIEKLDKDVRREAEQGRRLKGLVEWFRHGDRRLLGESPAMAAVRMTALTAARTSATVLLEGETGTGKEVLAQFIHDNSPRKDKPFIKVDCATIPATLIESHLFGHEKGAFTGADAQAVGMFEKAGGGTLFLDEASNLPLSSQVKLLQFFNDFTILRVGGTTPIRLDVRCIVAANRSLEGKVREGTFREDLFYRISVIRIRMPLLRERPGDVAELARHFLKTFTTLHNKEVEAFAPEAVKKLEGHSWPGNVRELKNTVENAVIFCDHSVIKPEFIHFVASASGESPVPKRRRQPFKLGLTDPSVIRELLNRHYGSVEKAAKEIGVSKVSLYVYLKEKKMDPTGFRRGFGQ